MSQENVEVVRGVYGAFTRRDAEIPFASYATTSVASHVPGELKLRA